MYKSLGTPDRFGVPRTGQLSASAREFTHDAFRSALKTSSDSCTSCNGFLFQTCPQTTKASQCVDNCLSGILKVDEILCSGLLDVPAILVSATHCRKFGLAMVCHQCM